MELEVKRQLLQLVAAYAAGLGLGVIYDVLRAIRRRLGLNWFFDLLFVGALGFVLFTLGMSVGDGELNLFMAGFAALGFYTYMRLLSRLFLPVFAAFTGLLALILRPFRIVGKFVEVLGNGHTNASFYEIITDFSAISYWIQEWIEVLKQISPELSDKDSKHKNLYSVKQISNYFLIF